MAETAGLLASIGPAGAQRRGCLELATPVARAVGLADALSVN